MTVATEWEVILLAAGSLVFGLTAAWYWWRSTRVPVDPSNGDPHYILPVIPTLATMAWQAAQFSADQKISRLNRIAAVLSAVAVLLGAAATFWGLH